MREEFHGDGDGVGYKKLYGWNSINANVWLPSLSELVGITGAAHPTAGVYYSAMQGLGLSSNYWTDAQGGDQFNYFKQYNAMGGGTKIWHACKQEVTWLRSPRYLDTVVAWVIDGDKSLNAYYSFTSESFAVHPAVADKSN